MYKELPIKYANTKAEVPKVAHFAIIIFSQYSTAGYDQGDPDIIRPMCEYRYCMDENDWKEEIRTMMLNERKDFVALKVNPAEIKTEFKIDIK